MQDGPLLSFTEWKPDLSSISANASQVAENVIPRADGFGPFPSFVALTQSLPGQCRGGFYARNLDGSITVFAATADRLWRLDNTDFHWVDVSKGGAAYPSAPSGDLWQFVQFGNRVFVVQQNVVMQGYTLGVSAAFADQPGTPPQAGSIAIINRFVVLTRILSLPFRVQWCDLDDPTTWTPGVGQADFQDLPDGGTVHAIQGGDQYGIILQDASIRSMVYQPGSATVFQILRISTQDGLFGQYSSVTAGDQIFICSPQGFKVIKAGGYPTPIGKEQVDRTFFADVDQSNLQLFQAATDPTSTRVYWMYKSKQGITGTADKMLVYDWALQEFTLITGQMLEFLMYLTKPGLTLEGLDSIAPGIINILSAANNGSGAIRLEVDSLTAGTPPFNTDLNIENTVSIYDETGGVPHGVFRFTIIDATHIDLIGSTFTATGTGKTGGSLDQLGFSLDSFGTAPLPQFAAFSSSDHTLGTFSGTNLEAIIETPDQDLGERLAILWLRPISDAPSCYGSLGIRSTAAASLIYTSEQPLNAQGLIPARAETRYARARIRVPAATVWTYATGVKAPDAQLAQGDR